MIERPKKEMEILIKAGLIQLYPEYKELKP
jgi:hypothetical protein